MAGNMQLRQSPLDAYLWQKLPAYNPNASWQPGWAQRADDPFGGGDSFQRDYLRTVGQTAGPGFIDYVKQNNPGSYTQFMSGLGTSATDPMGSDPFKAWLDPKTNTVYQYEDTSPGDSFWKPVGMFAAAIGAGGLMSGAIGGAAGAAGAGGAGGAGAAEEIAALTGSGVGGGAGAAGIGTAGAGAGYGLAEEASALGIGDLSSAGITSGGITPQAIQAVTQAAQAGKSAKTIGQMLGISDSLVNTIAAAAGPTIGALLASNAAGDAADIQGRATDAAISEQRRQYDINRADLEPWRTAGTSAIGDLSSRIAPGGDLVQKFSTQDFYNDPVNKLGFQFGLDEGLKQLRRSAPGMRDSGPMLKALTKYATDYTGSKAADSYNRFVNDQTNIYNRIAGVAGTGQNAVNTGVNAGANTANNVSNLISSQGNAAGASAIAQGNIYGMAGNTIGNYFSQNSMLDRILSTPRYYGGSGSYGS